MQNVPDKDLQLGRFLETLGDACLLVTPEGIILAANSQAGVLYGAIDPGLLIGRTLGALCAEEDRCIVDAGIRQCNGKPIEFEAMQQRDDGASFLGAFTAKRHVSADSVERLLLTIRRLEHDLEACNDDLELHHLMLESALDGIVAHTIDGRLLYANQAALEQWGLSLEEVRARGPFGWVAPHMKTTLAERVAGLMRTGSARFESGTGVGDGNAPAVEVHARLVEGRDGPIVVSTVRDISERLQTEEMVRYLAYHDMLTGLANRVLLEQDLCHAIAVADRHGDLLGLAFVDLDNFKPVNDTYGHAIGDHVLREVADRISGCVREGDTVARVGGDEFVIVLPRLSDARALDVVAEKLCRAVSEPIHVNDKTINVSASVGTALHGRGEDAGSLLTRADLGMYQSRGVCVDGAQG